MGQARTKNRAVGGLKETRMFQDPFATLTRLGQRSTAAVLKGAGTKAAQLRAQLASTMAEIGAANGFLTQPILEAAHSYETTEERLQDLSGGLLHPSLVDALDGDGIPDPADRERYRFKRDQRPFRHQIEAWKNLLAPEPKSVVVTSGTGSGKTECFLVPLLNSLAEQASAEERAVGVQALMLYPLNALINSQRERLSDWTAPFGGKIRFALFNGETPADAQESERRRFPNEVIDRKRLREEPAPILVTNITMLEYMLVRFEDRPILNLSQGKLRYIILDEAHSYVGSQAAELSLLLRRVMFAFGVRPQDVRFVATSATIGKQGDPNTAAGLKTFLSQVAGVPEAQVVVIEGQRRIPVLPKPRAELNLPAIDEVEAASPVSLFDRLGATPQYAAAFNILSNTPLTFPEWCEALGTKDPIVGNAMLQAGARAEKNGEKLLPLRVHAFHRTQPGVWACLNSRCSGRTNALATPDWPFGAIQTERTSLCPHCTSPLFEIQFCSSCENVSLAAQSTPDPQGRQWLAQIPKADGGDDEFFSDLERLEAAADADDGEEEPDQLVPMIGRAVLVAPQTAPYGSSQAIDPDSGQILDAPTASAVMMRLHRPDGCPHCGATYQETAKGERSLSIRRGGPFLLGAIIPELLDDALPAPEPRMDGKPDGRLRPADGRQLLMFTDSRQGTARISAKLQRDSEQNHVRSFIYHTLQAASADSGNADRQPIEQQLAALRGLKSSDPTIKGMIKGLEDKLASLNAPKPISWSKMIDTIAHDDRINRFVREQVWLEREPELFANRSAFARFLLLREFLRQPPAQNNPETMGLASLRFQHLDEATQVPDAFSRHGGTLEDWRDLLYAALNRFVRNSYCTDIDPNMLNWINHRISAPKLFRPQGQKATSSREVVWPTSMNALQPIVRLLAQGLGLSLTEPGDRDDIDTCLAAAYTRIIGVCDAAENGFRLDFGKASLAPVQHAFVCPAYSGVLRDRTFRGLTTFVRRRGDPFLPALTKVALPKLPYPYHQDGGVPVAASRVAEWLANDTAVSDLRDRGLWSDLHDRISQYSVFYRTAEHSAQQPGYVLRRYETEFKAGRINVLSCSTTMEMGVDIGSISTVVNSDVPPSIASYRQRVGRAGRRGQPMALSLTLCRDRPIDRSVFRDPAGFLARTMFVPKVALDSAVIAQRHVNATLLGKFLTEGRGELHKMTVGPFFGMQSNSNALPAGESASEKFAVWLDSQTLRTAPDVNQQLKTLLAGTALEGAEAQTIDETRDAILRARQAFAEEWESVRYDLEGASQTGGRKTALEMQLRRISNEYLLADLAGRGFLPGYGFPTDVVTFNTTTYKAQATRIATTSNAESPNRRNRLRDAPSRQLDLAIRDYAPGSDVVVDGCVFRSAGIQLSWKRPVTEESAQNIHALGTAWRCRACGAIDTTHKTPETCSACGSANLIVHRFLKPTGFACDPAVKPHDKVEEATYVPAKAPWVAAQGGEWVHLTAKEAGRYRSSRNGAVFHHTLGPTGCGYAICLACGRAEPEERPEAEAPELPLTMRQHNPLRAKKKSLWCDGLDQSSRPFAIQRHRALGYEVSTDVFELQLPDLESADIAMPFGISLRDALARKLGIEDTEIGITATQSSGEDGAARWSVLIFDKAPGGAGFSITASAHIEELIQDAARILDCPNKGCTHGCPECVMCRDLEGFERTTDRPEALKFARKLAGSLGLAKDRMVFGGHSRAETQPLADAILRDMGAAHDADLTIPLMGPSDDWDFDRWQALGAAQRLAARGRRVRILIDPKTLQGLDQAARIEIFGQTMKAGCTLEAHPPIAIGGSDRLLAHIGHDQEGLGWASSDPAAWSANAAWGGSGNTTLVRGPQAAPAAGKPVDPATFLLEPERTAIVEIRDELDGPIKIFGSQFWSRLIKNSAAIGERAKASDPILAIEYSDRYLNSPLPIRLLFEVIRAAPGANGSTQVHIVTADQLSAQPASAASQMRHDWRLIEHRNAVLRDMIGAAFSQRFRLSTHEKRHISHGRLLNITYADRTIHLRLDQGFGYWIPTSYTPFGFSMHPSEQARALERATFSIRGSSAHATWIAVNEVGRTDSR
jgi:ATP-dependent helicase YprA (DUF1998 family)